MVRCSPLGPRFVGDPVDVVTGEVHDIAHDFTIDGSRPFIWKRHYRSQSPRGSVQRGLGMGHRHELDWSLRIGFDGIRIDGPRTSVLFPHLRADGDRAIREGWQIARKTALVYHVARSGDPVREFARSDTRRRHARLVRLLHPDGGEIQLAYRGTDGHELQSIRDSQGWSLYCEWHNGLLVSIHARTSSGEYTPIRYAYDERRHLRAGQNAYRHQWTWTYDEAGRVLRRSDQRGYSFVYAYDDRGRCIRAAGEDDVDAIALEYLPYETKVIREANGGIWWFRYLPTGQLCEIEDPLGGKRAFLTDESGRVLAQVDGVGDVWSVVRDGLGVEVGLRDPLGYLHPQHEDPNDPELDPLLHDVPGTVFEQEHGRSHPLEFDVPTMAAIQAVLSPAIAGALITSEFAGIEREVRDAAGLLVRKEKRYGNGHVARKTFIYDAVGNLQKVRSFDGGEWLHTYASWNHRTSTQDPLGHITQSETGKRDKRVKVRDPNAIESEYEWDLCDRLAAVRRHGQIRERYVRNLTGALIEKRNAKDEVLVQYERGPLGTLLRRVCKDAEETFRRDPRGRIVEATRTTPRGTNTIHREYDLFGRCRAEIRDGAGIWLDTAWPRNGRTTIRPRKPADDGSGPIFVIGYRSIDEHTLEITDPTGRAHQVRRILSGIIERRFAGGLVETSQYDGEGRCLARANENRRGVWRRRFTYSGDGDLRCREEERVGKTYYLHDAAHRLTAVHHPDGRVEPYEHDRGGNVVHMPGLSEGRDGTATSAPGANGRTPIAKAPGNKIWRANGDRFEYDDRDHVCLRHGPWGRTEYVRDEIGRLLEVVTRDSDGNVQSVLQNEHDALGRRIRKRWRGHDEAWQETTFFWDCDRLAAEILVDGRFRIYVYERIDALVPMVAIEYASVDTAPNDGQVFALQTDHRGAIERVEDEGGRSVWRATIGPYGECKVVHGAEFHQPFRLVGQYHDDETKLSGHRYRNWLPEVGRFLESDPVGIAGEINLYAWPGNPLTDSDPLGLGCNEGGDSDGSGEGDGNSSTRDDGPNEERAEQTQPTTETPTPSGYPPRTGTARAECQVVVNSLDGMIGKGRASVVQVFTHENGTVSVGVSGRPGRTSSDLAGQLEQRLNDGHRRTVRENARKNGEPVPRMEDIPPKYRVSGEPLPLANVREIPGGNSVGECGEPKAANASHGNPSPIDGGDTRWRGEGENPHPFSGENADGAPVEPTQMDPCNTCADPGNIEEYMQHANG